MASVDLKSLIIQAAERKGYTNVVVNEDDIKQFWNEAEVIVHPTRDRGDPPTVLPGPVQEYHYDFQNKTSEKNVEAIKESYSVNEKSTLSLEGSLKLEAECKLATEIPYLVGNSIKLGGALSVGRKKVWEESKTKSMEVNRTINVPPYTNVTATITAKTVKHEDDVVADVSAPKAHQFHFKGEIKNSRATARGAVAGTVIGAVAGMVISTTAVLFIVMLVFNLVTMGLYHFNRWKQEYPYTITAGEIFSAMDDYHVKNEDDFQVLNICKGKCTVCFYEKHTCHTKEEPIVREKLVNNQEKLVNNQEKLVNNQETQTQAIPCTIL